MHADQPMIDAKHAAEAAAKDAAAKALTATKLAKNIVEETTAENIAAEEKNADKTAQTASKQTAETAKAGRKPLQTLARPLPRLTSWQHLKQAANATSC